MAQDPAAPGENFLVQKFLLKLQFANKLGTAKEKLSKTFHVADLVAAVFGDSVGTVLQV